MKKIILAFLLTLLTASQLSAAPITLIREYTYQAGDADSKLSSRAVALEQQHQDEHHHDDGRTGEERGAPGAEDGVGDEAEQRGSDQAAEGVVGTPETENAATFPDGEELRHILQRA